MRECIKCKSNELTNKRIVMMINECGHPLCKNCVDNLFARNAAPCHVCGKTLRRTTFWEQIFDDPQIEKENFVRKKLKKFYNLKQDDFPSLREFNDYLERFEVVVSNLACGVDVEETEQEIMAFQKEFAEQIERNRRRYDSDQQWIIDNLKDEKDMKNRLNEAYRVESTEEKSAAIVDTKTIMNELRESDVAAETILDRERKKQIELVMEEKEKAAERKRLAKENLKSRRRAAGSTSFVAGQRTGRAYEYDPIQLMLNGPDMPNESDLENDGYLQHVKKASEGRTAGGYHARIACRRALFESRLDLFAC